MPNLAALPPAFHALLKSRLPLSCSLHAGKRVRLALLYTSLLRGSGSSMLLPHKRPQPTTRFLNASRQMSRLERLPYLLHKPQALLKVWALAVLSTAHVSPGWGGLFGGILTGVVGINCQPSSFAALHCALPPALCMSHQIRTFCRWTYTWPRMMTCVSGV